MSSTTMNHDIKHESIMSQNSWLTTHKCIYVDVDSAAVALSFILCSIMFNLTSIW